MKKLFTLMLILTMLVVSTSAVFASNLPFEISEMKVGLQIDGQIVEIPEGYGKVVVTSVGRTIVPVRFLSEALGYSVTWNGETSTVGIEKGEDKVEFPIGATEIQTKNGLVVMELPAFVMPEENRTYVPLRFAAEALNCEVDWVSHKNIEGSANYPYDYYVTIKTSTEVVSDGSFGEAYWKNVNNDEIIVDIVEDASKVNEVYNQSGMIMVGASSLLNSGELNVYAGLKDQVEIQIKNVNGAGVLSTVERLLNYWTGDDYAWNQLAVEFTETDGEWFVTSNGTQVKMTTEGVGTWVFIKK